MRENGYRVMQVPAQPLMWLPFMLQPRRTTPPRSLSSTSWAAKSLATSVKVPASMCKRPTAPASRLVSASGYISAYAAPLEKASGVHVISECLLRIVLQRAEHVSGGAACLTIQNRVRWGAEMSCVMRAAGSRTSTTG